MDEIASGMVPREDAVREPLEVEDTTPWIYSVTLSKTSLEGLTAVEVLVEQEQEKQFHPAQYRLVRWLPDEDTSSEDEPEDDEEDTNNQSNQSP